MYFSKQRIRQSKEETPDSVPMSIAHPHHQHKLANLSQRAERGANYEWGWRSGLGVCCRVFGIVISDDVFDAFVLHTIGAQ